MIKNLHYLNENQWMKGQTHEPQGHFLQFSPLHSILDRNWWPISCHTGRLLSEVWCINNDPLPNLMAPPWPELTSQAKGQNNRWNTDVVCYGRGFCSGASCFVWSGTRELKVKWGISDRRKETRPNPIRLYLIIFVVYREDLIPRNNKASIEYSQYSGWL